VDRTVQEVRKGGKEGRREGGKEGRREGGKEGRREGGKEGRREGGKEGRRGGGEVTVLNRMGARTWTVVQRDCGDPAAWTDSILAPPFFARALFLLPKSRDCYHSGLL
jgi:hypothetical protein